MTYLRGSSCFKVRLACEGQGSNSETLYSKLVEYDYKFVIIFEKDVSVTFFLWLTLSNLSQVK